MFPSTQASDTSPVLKRLWAALGSALGFSLRSMMVPSYRKLGHAVVYGMFGLTLLYVVVSVLSSILLDLYGNPQTCTLGCTSVLKTRPWCMGQLKALEVELENQALHELRPRLADPLLQRDSLHASSHWNRWHGRWSQQHDRIASICLSGCLSGCLSEDSDDLRSADQALRSLDEAYTSALERIQGARKNLRISLKSPP